jgi:hypothetical protein
MVTFDRTFLKHPVLNILNYYYYYYESIHMANIVAKKYSLNSILYSFLNFQRCCLRLTILLDA